LEATKAVAEEDIQRLRLHVEQLQLSQSQFDEHVTSLQADLSKLQTDHEGSMAKIGELKESKEVLHSAVKDLEDELAISKLAGREADRTIASKENQISSLQEEIQKNQVALSQAYEANADAEGSFIEAKRELEWRLEASRKARQELEGQLAETQVKLVEATSACELVTLGLEAERCVVVELRKSDEELRGNLGELEHRITANENESAQLREDLTVAKGLLDNFERSEQLLKLELEAQKEHVKATEDSKTILSTKVARYEEQIAGLQENQRLLEDQLFTGEEQHAATAKARSKLEAELEEAKAALADAKQAHVEKQAALSATENTLRDELDKERAHGANANVSIERLEAALKELEAKSESTATEQATKVSQLQEAHDELQSELQVAQEQLRQLCESKRSTEVYMESTKAKVEQLEEALRTSVMEVKKAQESHEKLSNELETVSNSKSDFQTQLKAERSRAIELEATLKEAEFSTEMMAAEHEKKFGQLRQEHDELQQQLDKTRTEFLVEVDAVQEKLKREYDLGRGYQSELKIEQDRATGLEKALIESESKAKTQVTEHETRIFELQQEQDDLQRQLSAAQTELHDLSISRAATQSELDSARKRVARLEEGLKEADKTAKRAAAEQAQNISLLEGTKDGLEQQLNEVRQQLVTLSEKKTELEVALKDLKCSSQASAQEHENRVIEMQETLNSLKQKLNGSRIEQERLQEAHDMLSSKLDIATSKIETMSRVEQQLQSDFDTEAKKTAFLEIEQRSSRTRVCELEDELSDMRNKLRESATNVGKLEGFKVGLEADLVTAKREKEQLENTIHKLKASQETLEERLAAAVADREALDNEMELIRQANCEIDQQLEKLRPELAAALESSDLYRLSSSEAEAKVDYLQQNVASLETRLGEMTEKQIQSQDEAASMDTLRGQMEHQLKTLGLELADLTSSHDQAKSHVDILESAKEKLEADLQTARNELTAEREENRCLHVELTRLHEENASLEEKTDRAVERALSLEDQLGFTQNGLSDVQSRITTVEDELAISQQSNVTLESKITTLQQEHDAANAAKYDLEEQKTNLAVQLAENEKTLALLKELIKELESNQAAEEAKISTLESDNSGLKSEIASLQEKIRKGQQIRASFEAGLGAIRVRLGVSNMSRRRMQSKLFSTEKVMISLRSYNVELEHALKATQAELEALKGSAAIKELEKSGLMAEYEAKIADLTEQIESNVGQISFLQDTMTTLSESLKISNDEVARLKTEVIRQHEGLTIAEKGLDELKKDVVDLQAQHSNDLRFLKDKDVTIEEIQQDKNDTIRKLESELKELKEASDAHPALLLAKEEKIKELQQSRQLFADESFRLNAKLQEMKSEFQDIVLEVEMMQSSSAAARLELEDTVRTKNTEISKVRSELETSRRVAEGFAKMSRELEADNIAKESQTEKLRKLNRDYANILSNLQTEIQMMKDDKLALEKAVEALQKKNDELVVIVGKKPITIDPDSQTASEEDLVSTASVSQSRRRTISSLNSNANQRQTFSSTDTRVDSRHSLISMNMLKPYQILGAEAAAGRLQGEGEEDTEIKRRLWELWEDQRARLPVLGNGNDSKEAYFGGANTRKKLQKKTKVESEKQKIRNFVRFTRSTRRVDRMEA
jgi:chromosome segregation ATPase